MLAPLRIRLDSSVADRVCAWSVEVDQLRVEDSDASYERLSATAKDMAERFATLKPGEVPGVAEARRLYKAFGVDPTRTRPSSEALLRRALKGQPLYRISNVVDVCNAVSLEFLLPIGLYDRAKVQGNEVTVRVGDEGEEYEGIRKGPVHLTGRLCVADLRGPFGSPTSDSLRTSIGESTERVSGVVFGPADVDPDRLRETAQALGRGLVEAAGGELVDLAEVSRS